jgi:CheY-like chemotaxis protein
MNGDGHKRHILIIDDSREILDLMQELLEDEGYRVTTSLAIPDLTDVHALAPDLIIQDLLIAHSPESDLTHLTRARLDPALARTPLILCTAAVDIVSEAEMAGTLRELGVRVVLKPFAVDDLLAVLAEELAEDPDWMPQVSRLPRI